MVHNTLAVEENPHHFSFAAQLVCFFPSQWGRRCPTWDCCLVLGS